MLEISYAKHYHLLWLLDEATRRKEVDRLENGSERNEIDRDGEDKHVLELFDRAG